MALLNSSSIQQKISTAFVVLALLTAAAGSVGMLASWRIGGLANMELPWANA
jgi:hypothetical protein